MIQSILKREDSPRHNKIVSFGTDIIHTVPNRLELFKMGELKKVRINRFRIETTKHQEIFGRFSLERIEHKETVSRFIVSKV